MSTEAVSTIAKSSLDDLYLKSSTGQTPSNSRSQLTYFVTPGLVDVLKVKSEVTVPHNTLISTEFRSIVTLCQDHACSELFQFRSLEPSQFKSPKDQNAHSEDHITSSQFFRHDQSYSGLPITSIYSYTTHTHQQNW